MTIKQPPQPSYEALEAELLAMRVERANHLADVRRVLEWFNDPSRKPAVNAFTEGPERQLAYRFESMLQGEFICTECGLRKNIATSPRASEEHHNERS